MGKNKGRNGGDFGHQKSSSLSGLVRQAQLIATQQHQEQLRQGQSQGGFSGSRPLLDVVRVRSLLESCSDGRGAPICTNAPFSDEYLKQYEYKKEREAARKTDVAHYGRLEALILEGAGLSASLPLPLQIQCIGGVARHHGTEMPFLLPSLTPLQIHLMSLALCRCNSMTAAALECLAESCPDELVCNGAAIKESHLLSSLRATEKLPSHGIFRESWEEADAIFLDVRPVAVRPLHANLLRLHLVGCTLSVPGLRTAASLCTALTDLSLHRLIIDGVPGFHLDWHDVLCSIFLQAFRSSQWCIDGDGSGNGDWSVQFEKPEEPPPPDSAAAATATPTTATAISTAGDAPPCFPSLQRLELSHCWPASSSMQIMQAFALSLFVSKKARHPGLGSLVELIVLPPARAAGGGTAESDAALRAQFQLSRVNFNFLL